MPNGSSPQAKARVARNRAAHKEAQAQLCEAKMEVTTVAEAATVVLMASEEDEQLPRSLGLLIHQPSARSEDIQNAIANMEAMEGSRTHQLAPSTCRANGTAWVAV